MRSTEIQSLRSERLRTITFWDCVFFNFMAFIFLVHKGDEVELKAESSQVVDDDDDPENRYNLYLL